MEFHGHSLHPYFFPYRQLYHLCIYDVVLVPGLGAACGLCFANLAKAREVTVWSWRRTQQKLANWGHGILVECWCMRANSSSIMSIEAASFGCVIIINITLFQKSK
jgi:hypothetical protein